LAVIPINASSSSFLFSHRSCTGFLIIIFLHTVPSTKPGLRIRLWSFEIQVTAVHFLVLHFDCILCDDVF
jgi:hypothetical protein